MDNNHLCDTCLNEFVTCCQEHIIFGIDVDPSLAFHKDADRVLECSSYMNRKGGDNMSGCSKSKGKKKAATKKTGKKKK